MRCKRPKRLDSKRPDERCKVLPFRPRDKTHRRYTVAKAERDIDRLLVLSRYENPDKNIDDYRARMVENVAAMLLLSALVAVGAFDLIDLQQIQHCASLGAC